MDAALRVDAASLADAADEAARAVEGVDAYVVRADERTERTLTMAAGKLHSSRLVTSTAVGVQVFSAGGHAYLHETSPTRASLREQVQRAVRLARQNARARLWASAEADLGGARSISSLPPMRLDPMTQGNDAILEVMRVAQEGARTQVEGIDAQVAFGARAARTHLRASNGTRGLVGTLVSTLRVLATQRDGARVGSGTARHAGVRGLEEYEAVAAATGAQAARFAREALVAEPLGSGRYRVLCDNELSGTLAHESFGHLTEFDLVSSGWSTLQGRLGETLAAPGVTVTDAPVSPGDPREGVAVPYDDQGTPGKPVTMLKDGVLTSWMHTRESAAEAGESAAGNGRALDARFPAIVRMRNTYFEPGDATIEEALEALGDGLYLIGARGGAPQSDGSFMFTAPRGYRVEGGRIAAPVRTTAIHGSIFDFLKNVEMLTRDFEVKTNFFGGCGKREQSFLHVGVGGPHVLVRDALVGGI